MVLFKNKRSYEKRKLLRDHGMSKTKKYWHEIVGFNYRMTNLQAAVGVAQMERFEKLFKQNKQYSNFMIITLQIKKVFCKCL